MSVQEQTQDTVKEVLELTSNIVLEVKAAAGTGGSIMAAVNKLEEVHTYVGKRIVYMCICTVHLALLCARKGSSAHITLARVHYSLIDSVYKAPLSNGYACMYILVL